ncbi:hypothetical protein [Vibrio cholerae]|uniref:hypothetical protein n=2 Tax=Vibrio cholerae TaxID=666 RepID=UPI000E65C209|nr:hypothetical protein [Vibrio cholerae]
MKAYVYNTESKKVVAIISGETCEQCEAKTAEMGFMGMDEYGLTYTPAFGTVDGLIPCDDAEELQASTTKYLMNPATGSVDTEENWLSEMPTWEGDQQAQFDSLIEVEKDADGDWVEVK